jgi:predicted DNA-binding ArsR family transcriptional regulator
MRFSCTKNSKKKDDKAVHKFHKNVDVNMKCHFLQNLNIIYIHDSFNFHLRNDDLIYIQNKKNENH